MGQAGIVRLEGLAEGSVQCVDGPVAFGHLVDDSGADPELDGGLREYLAVAGPALGDHDHVEDLERRDVVRPAPS